jgi:HEAT repeat protein
MLKIRTIVRCAALAAAVTSAIAGQALAAADPSSAGDPSAAAEKERKLIDIIKSDAPPKDKAIPCKQLAIYGSKNAVPALAALLPDKELSSWARIALEAIPDPAADAALREATGKLQGRLLIGVINSIGFRRDAAAVEGLAARLKDTDAEVASAAAVALGKIASADAAKAMVPALAVAPPVRTAVAEGCVRCAARWLDEGKADEAMKLYDAVRKADVPKQRLIEATRGAILARKTAGVPLLVEQLKSPDKAWFALGLTVARQLPGRETTDALVAELSRANVDRRVLLLYALADRGDAAALPAVLKAATAGPEEARVVAVGALAKLGDASCVEVLIKAAGEANQDLSQAAATVLAELPGKAVDGDLAARLEKADGKTRQLLIQVAGLRRIETAVRALLKAADDADGATRVAALTALGSTAKLADLGVLISRAIESKDAEEAKAAQDALRGACERMPDRDACAEKLAAAMPRASVAVKCQFVEILGVVGGTKALAAVGAAAKDSSPEIQDAASAALGKWMTPDAGSVLLDMAKNATDPRYRARALRGYLRIPRQLKLPADQHLAMCAEGWKLCRQDADRVLVIEALARGSSKEALSRVVPHLESAPLKASAAAAAVAIGQKIVKSDPALVADAMKKVLAAGGDAKVTAKAKAILDQADKAGK